MKITSIKIEMTDQEAADIITTAIEARAIQYWACARGESIIIERGCIT